jgi:hypothetical protein
MTRYPVRVLAGIAMLLTLVIAAACGDDSDSEPTGTTQPAGSQGDLVAVITSSDLAVGPQRFAFVLLQDDNPVSAESIAVRFFKVKDESNPQFVGEGTIPFSPLGIPGLTTSGSELTGVYYANVTFDEAGKWGAGFTVGAQSDPEKEVRVAFEVKPEPSTVGVGEKAIAADNLTLADAPLEQIDTSSEPDEPFHQLSISEALANDKPSVIAFATPAFCETRTCGPTMEIVRAAYDKFGDKVNWVHVEPFKLDEGGGLLLSNGNKVNSDAANAWELPSEPWVFVVDKDGTVTGRFDGPLTLEEIDFHLTQLTSTP